MIRVPEMDLRRVRAVSQSPLEARRAGLGFVMYSVCFGGQSHASVL